METPYSFYILKITKFLILPLFHLVTSAKRGEKFPVYRRWDWFRQEKMVLLGESTSVPLKFSDSHVSEPHYFHGTYKYVKNLFFPLILSYIFKRVTKNYEGIKIK